MFHNSCRERIAHLERLLDEEREDNAKLREALVDALQARPAFVHTPTPGGGTVHYMDDDAMVELEESGRAPS